MSHKKSVLTPKRRFWVGFKPIWGIYIHIVMLCLSISTNPRIKTGDFFLFLQYILLFSLLWQEYVFPELIWQTTPAPDVASVTRELTFGTRPSILAPVFCKIKKDYIDQEPGEKYKTKVVSNGSSYWFISYWWIYFCLVFEKRKRVPKPLLGCQNWVTSTGGCQNLVPGWHSQRRGPAWSVICSSV